MLIDIVGILIRTEYCVITLNYLTAYYTPYLPMFVMLCEIRFLIDIDD